jgi:hypothetical protein
VQHEEPGQGALTDFRERALAALGATSGMIAPQAAWWVLDEFGPPSRVVFHPYLFSPSFLGIFVAGGLVGTALGAELALLLRVSARGYSVVRVACGCLGGGWLASLPGQFAALMLTGQSPGFTPAAIAAFFAITGLGGWLGALLFFKATDAAPATGRRPPWARLLALALVAAAIVATQLRAFPSRGTAAERDAWARAHVRQYAALAGIVARIPVVVGDVGRVTSIAPTAGDRHSYASEMDGDELHFTLEVIGERGSGVFFADGTIEGDWIVDWRSGRWSSGGRTVPVDPRHDGASP